MKTNLPTEEQLRDATSQQLDARAAVLVMGWEYRKIARVPMWFTEWQISKYPPDTFSRDEHHAISLMRKLDAEKREPGEGLLWRITLEPDGLWLAQMLDYESDEYVLACEDRSDWLPTAICLAAIRYRLQAGIFTEAQLASLALFNEQQEGR